MSMIRGLDVSAFQTNVDWNKLRNLGFEFVYIKHSQGIGAVDKQFVNHFRDAKMDGFKVGIYHFATLNDKDEVKDANAEANFFLQQTIHLAQDLCPVVDVETNDIGLTKDEVEAWIATYYQAMGRKMMLYSGSWFLDANLNPTHKLGHIPVWLSAYPFDKTSRHSPYALGDSVTRMPKPPVGWAEWLVWQWTGYGQVDGVTGDADLNLAKVLPLNIAA